MGKFMTRHWLLGVCLFLSAGYVASEPEPSAPSQRWLTDLASAWKASARSAKPLFVVFRCEH
jgi:hypothetical protein